MAPPSDGVTIDISHKPGGDGPTYYGGNGGRDVKLEKEEDPPGSGFWKFKHTKNGSNGNAFHVEKVTSGVTPVSELEQIENIQYLAVWYHSGDKNHNQPLLIEIWEKGGTYKHYITKGGGSWNPHDSGSQSQLTGKELEQKLDYLNCQYYKSVNIDLTHNRYTSGKSYCCDKHKGTRTEKVSVTGNKVASQIPYVKHFIGNKSTLSGIKYYLKDGSQRKNITLHGSRFPTSVNSVYAFYCTGNGPSLICIKEESHQTVNWYKKPNGDDSQWTRVQGISNDPENIKNCKDNSEEFDRLVTELRLFGCQNLKTCTESSLSSSPALGASQGPQPALPTAGEGDLSGPIESSGANNAHSEGEEEPGTGSAASTATEDAAGEGKAEALGVGAAPAAFGLGFILKISSGVFGGSGAVGLAGYHLYKHTRDPWCDRAAIEIYLKYDLRETFDWSTHLLFLYVTASYETAKHQRNELIIHDKIIKTEEEAYEPGSNVIAKYYMVDYARGLRNKKIKLELHYDFVPIGGFMHKNKLSESYFSFPSAYIKYKGNR
ncbi:hypothetical protein BEWA_003080 [Theileria equi strain WA]|uniref:Signal peptidase complex subunit 3 n=1 Tax=Theileria equi strain WA TaxID=1537102 RepID=L0AZC9_THEEQ|nr:hypothetical protein BEWA_003080 [Theileria equi strain WA]AFZ80900.1 hypothetical protein BEWA_003080 [Theileria equi strain WA]|eukprot:XP_004830566.1 hypothetical protein BEWA_003080 [Theileria equi strain WA]